MKRLLRAGVKALGIRRRLHIEVVPGPGRTRGCATVGGDKVVIQIAPPGKLSRRKLAAIFRHELRHIEGLEHDDMSDFDLWSKGGEPDWSQGKRLRYRRRGEDIEGDLQ